MYMQSSLFACHEGIRESEGITPCILNMVNRWRRLVGFTARPFPSGEKRPRYSFNRGLNGNQKRWFVEENIFAPVGKQITILLLSNP